MRDGVYIMIQLMGSKNVDDNFDDIILRVDREGFRKLLQFEAENRKNSEEESNMEQVAEF